MAPPKSDLTSSETGSLDVVSSPKFELPIFKSPIHKPSHTNQTVPQGHFSKQFHKVISPKSPSPSPSPSPSLPKTLLTSLAPTAQRLALSTAERGVFRARPRLARLLPSGPIKPPQIQKAQSSPGSTRPKTPSQYPTSARDTSHRILRSSGSRGACGAQAGGFFRVPRKLQLHVRVDSSEPR